MCLLRLSCCKWMCGTSLWSIHSSWLGNSKLLSLRTEGDLIYLESGLMEVIKFSAPLSVISFSQEADEGLSAAPLCCGSFVVRALHPTMCSGQGICAHGQLIRVLSACTALCRLGCFCVQSSGAEKLKGLKISYFGFSAIFGICIMLSESAGMELSTRRAAVKQLWAGSEQDNVSVCLWGRRTPGLAGRRC